jgi:hypothetical protein
MGSSDNIFDNSWSKSGGEKVTEWEDGKGISGQVESGKKPDTKVTPWQDVKSDF